jgi:hypothetical protein
MGEEGTRRRAMSERYSGLVRIGGQRGAVTEVTITDLDSNSWTINFAAGSVPTEGERPELLVQVELLEGSRAGQSAWGDLELERTEDGPLMAGRSPFHRSEHHGEESA